MIVAGIGFRSACVASDIVDLVRAAAERAGHAPSRLAAPGFKNSPALREAAEILRLPLVLLERDALDAAQSRCMTRSATAERAVGLASVAEAAALAAAGTDATLLLPRMSARGVTCALGFSA